MWGICVLRSEDEVSEISLDLRKMRIINHGVIRISNQTNAIVDDFTL